VEKFIVFISLNSCGIVGIGLGAIQNRENEFCLKKEYF
jgi:hypothetical protein